MVSRSSVSRLRNWGLGLIVASVILEIVGIIMAPWGQVRHFRGTDMVNHIYLTR